MGPFAEHFINFVIAHNTTVIEVVVLAIMLSALYLAFHSLRQSNEEHQPTTSSNMPALDELEKTLQKILEKTSVSAPGSSAPSEETLKEIEVLKGKLADRQKEIDALKVTSQAPGLNAEDKGKLEEKIKELSAKLSEYEIISEDIADLSLYKEENSKLRKEIEGLKSARPEAPVQAPPALAVVPDIKPEKKPEPEIVVPKREPPPLEPAPEVAATAAPVAEPGIIDDDLLAEFAKAVEQQKVAEKTEAEAAANNVTSPETEAKSDINFDKILSEANNLPDGSNSAVTSLDVVELNTAKLEGEADQLAGNDS